MFTTRTMTALASIAFVAAAAEQAHGAVPATGQSRVSTAGTWSAPFRVLPAGGGAAISCPLNVFCTAVSYDGSAAQGHGRQWGAAEQVIPAPDNPYDVSCAPDQTCMVVSREDHYATFDGGSWSTAAKVPRANDSLWGASCLSAEFCQVVDGQDVLAYDGQNWGAPARLPQAKGMLSISCTSRPSTFCAATGYVLAYTWAGDEWVKSRRLDKRSNIWSVSCVSPTFCMASDDRGRAFQWNGASWSSATVAIPGLAYSSAVSCVTKAFCVMATEKQSEVSFFDGTSWSEPTQIDDPAHGGLTDIDCPKARYCTALDKDGYVLTWHRDA